MSEKIFPNNFPAPDEYLLELGRITALWGSLESSVDMAVNKLAGFDDSDSWRCSVLIAHSNFKQRVDIIETLCHSLKDEFPQLSEYKKTIKLISQAQTKRNHFLHNGLHLNEEDGKVYTNSMSARGKIKISIKTIEVNELKEVSADIHLALLSIHEMITGVKYPPVWER